ncbi:MAG: universal stress protein [Pseudomonadota bacterium]
MYRFKSILFALTDAEDDLRGVAELADLAQATGAKVRVMGMDFAAAEGLRHALSLLGRRSDMADRVREAMVARTERVCAALTAKGVPATACFREGKPFIAAIQEAMAIGADLIAVPAAGDASPTPFMQHLMRKAPCPVWLMRPRSGALQRGFNRILCAVDPQLDDPEKMRLATSTLRLARSLTDHHNAALTVLHSWHVGEIGTLRSSGFVSASEAEIDAIEVAAETAAQAGLDALVTEHSLTDVGAEIILSAGNPAETIPATAETIAADLVVLGTVGRAGIPGLLIGNTAEAVLGKVTCSVMAVKPEGFVSPVSPGGTAQCVVAATSGAHA